MEKYVPITSLFDKNEITTLEFTINNKVLSKSKLSYIVYIDTKDGEKYYYEESTLKTEPKIYTKMVIDPVNRTISLS